MTSLRFCAGCCTCKCSIPKSHVLDQMGLVRRKPVFGVSDKVGFKQACSATITCLKVEISLEASLDTEHSIKRKTKALIRLRGCAGWCAPLLFATPRRQIFSRMMDYSESKWQVKKVKRFAY